MNPEFVKKFCETFERNTSSIFTTPRRIGKNHMINVYQQFLDAIKPDYDKAIQIIETFHKHQEEKQALIGNDTFIVRFNTGNKDKEPTAFEKFLASIGAQDSIVSLVKDERGNPVDVNTLRTKKLESELAELKEQVVKLQAKPKKKKRS